MKAKIMLVFTFFILFFSGLSAQEEAPVVQTDSLDTNVMLLKRYLSHGSKWYFTNPLTHKRLSGLIHFIEDEPVDTIINYLNRIKSQTGHVFIVRKPQDAYDSLRVPGYIPVDQLLADLTAIEKETAREYEGREIQVPSELLQAAEKKAPLVPEGNGMQLFTDGIFALPDSLKILDAIPDNMVQNQDDFRRLLEMDMVRSKYVEQKRIQYNDSLLRTSRDSVTTVYRMQLIRERADFLKNQKIQSVRTNNYQVLKFHNDQVIAAVNDSISQAVGWLTGFADLIDNTTVHLMNISNATSPLVLSNSGKYFTRVWLKNKQNDSLAVLVQNMDKKSMQLVIEDGVTFSRFKQQSVKDFDFTSLNKPSNKLEKVVNRYQAYTPWTIGGDGNIGFTQTYLSNWKKGGKNSLSTLIVAKGFANYASQKVKWENNAEFRNGWIKPGEDPIQKNDDKISFISRLGVSAFQKWYYSTEANFETQFFYGYKYPNTASPISGFLAPGRFLFKIGFDYKPNKDFSLFISPLTSKTIFMSDTLKVDKSSFGIEPGKRALWDQGFNTDLKYKKAFTSDINYETKFGMFINYGEPLRFNKIDFDWENLLIFQFTNFISMRLTAHTIYDPKVLFDKLDKDGKPVLDANGKKIRETKLQFKELLTVGFSYKINRRVLRAREINHP